MKNTIVRELFLILLLILVIMGTLKLVLYDFIPSKNDIPEFTTYKAESRVSNVLNEINKDEEIEKQSNNNVSDSLLKSYTIEQSDLKNYVSKNAYESGKINPFDDYVEINKNKSKNKKNNNTNTTNR